MEGLDLSQSKIDANTPNARPILKNCFGREDFKDP